MCVAIPSRIEKIDRHRGIVDIDGVKREISLLLLEDVSPGDWVIIHAGFAIHKIDASKALESLELLHEAFSGKGIKP
ncbi:MAG: HypC/HybG/HupF family hydrogenase formation chaperone [Deltaproteobacteria bacterium]|nr:HypC/HybG/HupF family hydrogenase formation chaperone [Deltaproteobacteria bacterium]